MELPMKGNTLVLKDLPADSKWCDKDRVMLLACFQLLVNFVEKEKPQNIVDFKHDRNQRAQWKEIQALYKYWKKDRPAEDKHIGEARLKWSKSIKSRRETIPGENLVTEVLIQEDRKARNHFWKWEDRFEKREEEMLQRLIGIRQHLWC